MIGFTYQLTHRPGRFYDVALDFADLAKKAGYPKGDVTILKAEIILKRHPKCPTCGAPRDERSVSMSQV